MFRTFTFFIFFIGVQAKGFHNSKRILNGEKSGENEFPFAVNILEKEGKSLIPTCGGSILSEEIVLTAAHCFECGSKGKANVVDFYVVSHSSNLKKGELAKVIKGICHPEWNPDTLDNDIALLKVGQPFLNIKPVTLWSQQTNELGLLCTIMGWGKQELNVERKWVRNTPTSYTMTGLSINCMDGCDLYKASMRVIPFEKCSELLVSRRKLPTFRAEQDNRGKLCAYARNESVCSGDSGGPLFCSGVQFGILSGGVTCMIGYPAIFTKVSHYENWIKETKSKLERDTDAELEFLLNNRKENQKKIFDDKIISIVIKT